VIPFRTTPQASRRLVPEPLRPNDDDVMFLMIGQMNSDEFGDNREAFLAVPSSFGALSGNYAVVLYLDSGAAIASGREVWGWPKKEAAFRLGERNGIFTASVERGGAEIIGATVEITGPASPSQLELDPTWFNLKLIPSVLPGLPPDVKQITSTTLQNVRVEEVRVGVADLRFQSTPADPLAELIEVREVLPGIHLSLDCDLTLGEVLHDYLAEETLAAQVVPNVGL
jgi:acetoacetate decarboxylase